MTGIRQDHVTKLVSAQRAFDDVRPGDGPGRRRTAAILGALYRNASPAERRAYESQLGPGGRAPREQETS